MTAVLYPLPASSDASFVRNDVFPEPRNPVTCAILMMPKTQL
jgi:hypothetical protein